MTFNLKGKKEREEKKKLGERKTKFDHWGGKRRKSRSQETTRLRFNLVKRKLTIAFSEQLLGQRGKRELHRREKKTSIRGGEEASYRARGGEGRATECVEPL